MVSRIHLSFVQHNDHSPRCRSSSANPAHVCLLHFLPVALQGDHCIGRWPSHVRFVHKIGNAFAARGKSAVVHEAVNLGSCHALSLRKDIRNNIKTVMGGFIAAVRIWVSEFLASVSAALRLSMIVAEEALINFGSRLTTPIILIGSPWAEPMPDKS